MLAVVGTVPSEGFPLTSGEAALRGTRLFLNNHEIEIHRGTPALMAAACNTSQFLGGPPVFSFLSGDTGLGKGSRLLYERLAGASSDFGFKTVAFHYLQPDVDWHNKVLFAMEELTSRPILIADAGFMYAAKISGLAASYDLFTPDIGELAFLADETAPHPFYTRGFILHEENKAPALIARAQENDNSARCLLVKGRADLIAVKGKILASVDQPVVEAMEAIGGTGDTLTGMASALIASGMAVPEASILAAKTNRLAGKLANLSPASQIGALIRQIPAALDIILRDGEPLATGTI